MSRCSLKRDLYNWGRPLPFPSTTFLSASSILSSMDPQELNIDRHPQLYFPDGNIALLATKPLLENGGQSRHLVFRVHKFLLRHHSETFANMIADAHAETDTVYDGVPLVEMHGDNAEDLATLLNYLYNPSCVVLPYHLYFPSTPPERSPSSDTIRTPPSSSAASSASPISTASSPCTTTL